MKRAPRSRQRHDLYAKYHDYDSEISDLLGECGLKFTGIGRMIEVRQVKYLNNIIEQDHRFIKRITRPMMGFKAFHSAIATVAGIETAHMIRKGQIPANGASAFQTFARLAA